MYGHKRAKLNPHSSTTNQQKSKSKSFTMMRQKRSIRAKGKRSFRERQVRNPWCLTILLVWSFCPQESCYTNTLSYHTKQFYYLYNNFLVSKDQTRSQKGGRTQSCAIAISTLISACIGRSICSRHRVSIQKFRSFWL